MPNLYITPTEIKAAMPEAIRSTTTAYDSILMRLSNVISRKVDNHCNRKFHPTIATRYFDGRGKTELKGLAVGDTYRLRNVQDYFVDFVTGIVPSNKIISVDMQAVSHTVATPVGWTAPAKTYPLFGCFVLEKA